MDGRPGGGHDRETGSTSLVRAVRIRSPSRAKPKRDHSRVAPTNATETIAAPAELLHPGPAPSMCTGVPVAGAPWPERWMRDPEVRSPRMINAPGGRLVGGGSAPPRPLVRPWQALALSEPWFGSRGLPGRSASNGGTMTFTGPRPFPERAVRAPGPDDQQHAATQTEVGDHSFRWDPVTARGGRALSWRRGPSLFRKPRQSFFARRPSAG
jgi:hypothetical protein